MPLTRREFIAGLGAVTGIRVLEPFVVRAGDFFGQTLPPPASFNRLVVIFLGGGNDGLNTVVPTDGARRDVYDAVRPSLRFSRDALRATALDRSGDVGQNLALNPNLRTLHSLYRSDRVAIVQGVDYPGHSFSHFVSTDIWESGQPGQAPDSGWLGRHLDREPASAGQLKGLGIGSDLPLTLRGDDQAGVQVSSVEGTRFADGRGPVADPRHAAFARFAGHDPMEPLRRYAGIKAKETVELVDALANVAAPPRTSSPLANALLNARALMQGPFGVECVFVHQGGYDTHTSQGAAHANLMTALDQAIEAFLFGTMGGAPVAGLTPYPAELAARTLIMTVSEFGRRVGENGTGAVSGTDHGSSAPLFLVGPPPGAGAAGVSLAPGLHGDHPPMGTVSLPADNLQMTTDLRRVYQSVLQEWLADPDPSWESGYEPIGGLFSA